MVPEDHLDVARAQARQEGYEEGYAQAQASVEARSAEALVKAADKLAAQAATAIKMVEEMQKEHLREAVSLAATIARKLAVHLIARHPQAELAALIEESLASLEHAPHLVVRCHPDLCDAMQAAATERMKASGFSGRLVVMGDPDIRLGDGRIEWADGGLVRDINAISGEIDKRISTYLTARGADTNNGG
nr:FliH/SctL family protein [Pelagibacterium limicola]